MSPCLRVSSSACPLITLLLSLLLTLLTAPVSAEEVTLYTSVDEPVARPILTEFERKSGIKVVTRTDTEATKGAGLSQRLQAEKDNPQADVWWGNDIFDSINLAQLGILAPYESPAAAAIPAGYKDPKHRWAGTALRARVIGITEAVPEAAKSLAAITSIEDLTRPEFKGRICMAMPRAGTTRGHVASLYALWGKEKADAFFRALKANDVKTLGGNAVVAHTVGRGDLWLGLTDNDDIDAVTAAGGKIRLVLPDQGEGQIGTLTIPCTVGLVAGAKQADAAKKLIDYLLSPEVEQKLLDAKFARYSVFADIEKGGVRRMNVDYAAVAATMKESADSARRILEGR